MSLPNLTSVKINRKIQPIPDQSIFNMLFILSSRLTTLGLYNLHNIPEESILVLLHSCSSRMKTIHLSGNSNITDVVLLKIFQKFGSSLESLDLSNTNVTGEILSEFNGSLPVITELDLFNSKLTDTGLLYLLHLGRKTLDSMVITYTPITGEKLKEFEGTMECLETFDFHSCEQITDGGKLTKKLNKFCLKINQN